jgi:hypothetical protein
LSVRAGLEMLMPGLAPGIGFFLAAKRRSPPQ